MLSEIMRTRTAPSTPCPFDVLFDSQSLKIRKHGHRNVTAGHNGHVTSVNIIPPFRNITSRLKCELRTNCKKNARTLQNMLLNVKNMFFANFLIVMMPLQIM